MPGRVEQWAKTHRETIGLVGALVAILAVVATLVTTWTTWWPGDKDNQASPPSQTSSPAVTSSTSSPPTAEGSSLFWTADGGAPSVAQTCPGLLGFCIGGSLEAVESDLGFAARSNPVGEGAASHTWSLTEGLDVTFTTLAGGDSLSRADLTTVEEEGTPPVPIQGERVSLPGGLVFGNLSMGEVQVAHPGSAPAVGSNDDEAQGVWVWVCFLDGPEATRTVAYGTYVSSNELRTVDLPLLESDGSADEEMLSLISERPVQRYAIGLEETMGGFCA